MKEIPAEARNRCEGCECYEPAANPPQYTCRIGRPQHVYWNAANNQVIRPFSALCSDPEYRELIASIRASCPVGASTGEVPL